MTFNEIANAVLESGYLDTPVIPVGRGQQPVASTTIAPPTAPQTINLKEGEYLFKQGDAPKGLYLVKSGALKSVVLRKHTRGRMNSPEYIAHLIGADEFVGYQALIEGTDHQYFVKAVRPTEVQVFPKETVTSLLQGSNPVMKGLLRQLNKDLAAAESVMQLHYLASVQERISHQLVLLTEKFGTPVAEGIKINLKLTRNELAQLAGTINESLSRHLTELKSEGIVGLVGKEIIVKNLPALKSRSGNY